jgi:hypothetical protein
VANALILRLDVAMDSRPLSAEERDFRCLLKHKLLGLASLERTIARHRCRIHWLSEGDACMRFFHLHTNHHRRKNFIDHLKVDGVLISDQDDKAKAVDSFYEQLLGSCPEHGYGLDLDFLGMQAHDLSGLEVTFSEEEVWGVIHSQELDKAPRPDGFTGNFYASCWSIIKEDVMEAFRTRGQSGIDHSLAQKGGCCGG